ncbi:MAG: histidine phosphatase family protein [Oscillospiraceae bacterium]|nr:histidine phosphatase family protein [Oscillospiraceae bacterium]
MKAYRIQFIRHGMTQGNLDGKYIGLTDEGLCQKGIDEIKEKIEKYNYPHAEKIYVSPLKRCRETAELIYTNCTMRLVPELREMNFGEFENKRAIDLMEREDYKNFLKGGLDNPAPGGESMRDLVERCYWAADFIITDMMKLGITSTAVITHGGIIMNMLSCFGLPKLSPMELPCDFGEGYEVLVTADMWQRSNAFEILGKFPYLLSGENE